MEMRHDRPSRENLTRIPLRRAYLVRLPPLIADRSWMREAGVPERRVRDVSEYSVATLPPTARQRQLAFGVVVFTLLAYGAVAPFAGLPLQRYDGFVPAMAALMFV